MKFSLLKNYNLAILHELSFLQFLAQDKNQKSFLNLLTLCSICAVILYLRMVVWYGAAQLSTSTGNKITFLKNMLSLYLHDSFYGSNLTLIINIRTGIW